MLLSCNNTPSEGVCPVTQRFGGIWTLAKLDIINTYLSIYQKVMTQMKNEFGYRLCYIDAFAGSGSIEIDGQVYDGSAIKALEHDFDCYYFLDKKKKNIKILTERIQCDGAYTDKIDKINFITDDCNNALNQICAKDWSKWRGVAFLDPFAMELEYRTLQCLARTEVFDVWYLFPFEATLRCMQNDGKTPSKTSMRISKALGTDEWKEALYSSFGVQLDLFGEVSDEMKKRDHYSKVKDYVIRRFSCDFRKVLKEPHLFLRYPRNNPIFLLCFMCNNPSVKAQSLAVKLAKDVCKKYRTPESMEQLMEKEGIGIYGSKIED